MSSNQSYRSLGFIGLGAMGYFMCLNYRQKTSPDISIHIYDVDPKVLRRFEVETRGNGPVHLAASAEEVVSKSDLIVTIVPEGKHVAAVFSVERGGSLAGPVEGKVFVECSTIDIETSARVCGMVSSRGAIFIDAPVSGGTTGAQAGTITFMLGSSDENPHFEPIKAVLSTMGTNILACGGPTLGLATKICNNYVSGTIAIATSEGINLARRLGLDPKTFSKVLGVSTGGSWINTHCNPCPGVVSKAPASHDYAPGFKVQLMRKDYNLAVEAAKKVGATMILAEQGLKAFSEASADPRYVDKDCRVIYRFIGGDESM